MLDFVFNFNCVAVRSLFMSFFSYYLSLIRTSFALVLSYFNVLQELKSAGVIIDPIKLNKSAKRPADAPEPQKGKKRRGRPEKK